MLRHITLLTKIVLSVGLIWYAFTRVDVGSTLRYLSGIPLWAIVLVMALLFLQLVVCAFRLKGLLSLLGARFSILRSIDAVMIGAFFSQTMISFVGGDAMRVWRIARSQIAIGTATRSILLDRIAGFASLIILIIAVMPFLMGLVQQPEMRLSLMAAVVAMIIGFAMFFLLWRIPARLKQWRLLQWTADLSKSAFTFAKSRKGIAVLIGMSLVIQLSNVMAIYIIAIGLSVPLSFADAVILIPLVMFISMLPISVAGWGVREGAMVVALGLVGIPAHQSLALSICFGLCTLAISLPGGVLWFVHRAPPTVTAKTA